MTEHKYAITEWIADNKRPAEYHRDMTEAEAIEFAARPDILTVEMARW